MLIDTDKLGGYALAWAVAKAKGYVDDPYEWLYQAGRDEIVESDGWRPFEWQISGQLIDELKIAVEPCNDDFPDLTWAAHCEVTLDRDGDVVKHLCFGSTAQIAICRCYVQTKLGDKVEIPDELCEGEH